MSKPRDQHDAESTAARPPATNAEAGEGSRDARLEDALVHLTGERAWEAIDPSDPAHAAFLSWWAGETRRQQAPAERSQTDTAADAFAAAMRARLASSRPRRRATVDLQPAGPPVFVDVPPTRLSHALEVARLRGCAPVLDLRVAAGSGRVLWDEPCERWVQLPDAAPAGSYLVLTVAGDSMTPLLESGDLMLVRLDPEIARDAVVVARLPDDGYVVKQVGRLDADTIELRSRNPNYAPIAVPRTDDVVLGTVILRWRTGVVGAGAGP